MLVDNYAKCLLELKEILDPTVAQASMLTALEHLVSKDLKGFANVAEGVINLEFGTEHRLELYFGDDRQRLVCFSRMPMCCCKERRATMGELIDRINFRLDLGCFIMDRNDGEIRFKYCHYYGDTPITDCQFKRALEVTIQMTLIYEDTINPLCLDFEPMKPCKEYEDMTDHARPVDIEALLTKLHKNSSTPHRNGDDNGPIELPDDDEPDD